MIVLFRKQMDNVRLQLIIHLNVQPSRTARIQGLKSKGKREIWEIGKQFWLLLWFLKGKSKISWPPARKIQCCWSSGKVSKIKKRPKGWNRINLMQHEFPKLSPPSLLLWYYSFIIYLGRSQTLLEINSGKKVEQSKGGITSAWLEGVACKTFILLGDFQTHVMMLF